MKLKLTVPALTIPLTQNPYISLSDGGHVCDRASFSLKGKFALEEGQTFSGEATVLSDDDMVLNTINTSSFLRYEINCYDGEDVDAADVTTYLLFTNDPIPEPMPEPVPPTEEELLAMAKMGKPEAIMASRDAIILEGVDVTTEYGMEKFALHEKDRTLLLGIYSMVQAGATVFPYHSIGANNTNNMCNIYSDADIAKIAMAAFGLITYHESYANLLIQWIYRETDRAVVESIVYGAELPVDLKEYFDMILTAAMIIDNPTVPVGPGPVIPDPAIPVEPETPVEPEVPVETPTDNPEAPVVE